MPVGTTQHALVVLAVVLLQRMAWRKVLTTRARAERSQLLAWAAYRDLQGKMAKVLTVVMAAA